MYKNLDKENMFNAIWEFPDNLLEAFRLGENIKLKQDYSNIEDRVVNYKNIMLDSEKKYLSL